MVEEKICTQAFTGNCMVCLSQHKEVGAGPEIADAPLILVKVLKNVKPANFSEQIMNRGAGIYSFLSNS